MGHAQCPEDHARWRWQGFPLGVREGSEERKHRRDILSRTEQYRVDEEIIIQIHLKKLVSEILLRLRITRSLMQKYSPTFHSSIIQISLRWGRQAASASSFKTDTVRPSFVFVRYLHTQ